MSGLTDDERESLLASWREGPGSRDPGIVTMPDEMLAELWESNEPDDAPGLRAAVEEFKKARHWDESTEDRLVRFRAAAKTRNELPPTLTDFLLARIAEDEGAARAAFMDWQQVTSTWEVVARAGKGATQVRTAANSYGSTYPVARTNEPAAAHIARHDPARVLADCEAMRRIVESMGDDWVTRTLALPYADHADYQEEWKP